MTIAQRTELNNLIEYKILEVIGDPDAGLELRPSFVRELKRRLKGPQKYISHAAVMRKYGAR